MVEKARAREILERAKRAAIDYYELTGKPLGITGEYGEYLAAELMGLELAEARTAGYDAVNPKGRKIQIKARSGPDGKNLVGRVGSIRLKHDWDSVMLILLNENFEPKAIYEAERGPLEAAITRPGSKARNQRGQLGIKQFISVAIQVWPRD